MRLKHALAATATAALLATGGLASAQQSTPSATDPGRSGAQTERAPSGAAMPGDKSSASLDRSTLHEMKDDKAQVTGLNVTTKDLSDMDIYGSDGKKIGDVNKVLADSSNSVKAVTVDVGGFLGIGAREVVIPIDKLSKGQEKDRLQVTMTKDEIEKLDRWEAAADRSAPRRSPEQAETPSTPPAPSAPPTR